MATHRHSFGSIIVAFALAIMMISMGITTVRSMDVSKSSNKVEKFFKGMKNSAVNASSGNEIVQAVNFLTKNIEDNEKRTSITVALVFAIGILEVIAGALVIINFFLPLGLSAAKNFFIWFVFALWAVVLVLVDVTGSNGVMGSAFESGKNFLAWLSSIGFHSLILGAVLVARE